MKTFEVTIITEPGKCKRVQVSALSSKFAKFKFRKHHPDKPVIKIIDVSASSSIPPFLLGECGGIIKINN